MPTAIGWRTTRRLHQMEVTANIEVVFGMAKEKRSFLDSAFNIYLAFALFTVAMADIMFLLKTSYSCHIRFLVSRLNTIFGSEYWSFISVHPVTCILV